jgi:hypothetical protein
VRAAKAGNIASGAKPTVAVEAVIVLSAPLSAKQNAEGQMNLALRQNQHLS